MDFMATKGGRARVHEIRAAILAAGLTANRSGMSRYIRPLIAAGLMVHECDGVYNAPAISSGTKEKIYLRLPYATRTEGEILRYLLTHRFAKAPEIIAHVRSTGIARHPKPIYLAMGRLVREEYVRRVARGVYTLTRKTLALVGMSDVADWPETFKEPPTQVMRRLIVELLGSRHKMSQIAMLRHFVSLGHAVKRWHIHNAVRQLRRKRVVVRVSRSLYALAPRAAAPTGVGSPSASPPASPASP